MRTDMTVIKSDTECTWVAKQLADAYQGYSSTNLTCIFYFFLQIFLNCVCECVKLKNIVFRQI